MDMEKRQGKAAQQQVDELLAFYLQNRQQRKCCKIHGNLFSEEIKEFTGFFTILFKETLSGSLCRYIEMKCRIEEM